MTSAHSPTIFSGRFARLAVVLLIPLLAALAWTMSAGAADVALPGAEAESVAISFAPPVEDETRLMVTCTSTVTSHRQINTRVINGVTWRQFEDRISKPCTDGVDRSYTRRYWHADGGA